MQPQMQETTTAATRDKPGVAFGRFAKPAASLTGDMVTRRSLPGAAPAPVRPDDGTPADREGRLTGLVQTVLAGLRAWGPGLVPKLAAAGGSRHGLRWPSRRDAAVIFGYAYLFFIVAIFAWLKFMPDLLFPQ